MKIDAVLFDYGGVFTASPFGAAEAYALGIGIEPALLMSVVFGAHDTDTDHIWHQCERGEVPIADALATVQRNALAAGFTFDFAAMTRTLAADPFDRSAVIAAVQRARTLGVRTAVVTNNIKEYSERWRQQIQVDELFDAVIDSSHEGVRKPDPRIYEIALDRLDLSDPRRVVFLDDSRANVLAAEAIGMRGILVDRDPAPAVAELEALLDATGP